MPANRTYADVVRGEWKKVPVWFPNQKVALGDFGVIDDNCFVRQGNIKDRLDIKVKKLKNFTQKVDFSSSGDYTVTSTIDPPDIPVAKAKVELKFGGDKCVIFRSKESTSETIDNLVEVNSEITELHKANHDGNSGGWDRKWHWVSEVITAKPCIILGSFERNSSITFALKVAPSQIQGIGDLLDVGDLDVNLDVQTKKGTIIDFKGKLLTPMVTTYHLNIFNRAGLFVDEDFKERDGMEVRADQYVVD